jgi:hypothetical protein
LNCKINCGQNTISASSFKRFRLLPVGLETKLVDLNAAVRSSSLQALTQLLASEMSCWSDGIALEEARRSAHSVEESGCKLLLMRF